MGSGGQTTVTYRVPHVKPPFTLADLKKAIPPHCFQRSLLRSTYHLTHDLFFAYLFYYIATTYIVNLSSPYQYLAWPIYWVFQGCIMTGLWVIAHECGHRAFSDYQIIDDIVGFVLHTSMLTPYFSWKITHRRHHANTHSLEFEENHVPVFKSSRRWFDYVPTHPLGLAIKLLLFLVLGWPLYLLFNVAGRKYEKFTTHFNPNSPLFTNGQRVQVLISNAGILVVCFGLYRFIVTKGLACVFCVYGVPFIIVNVFLALITFLHHTHAAVPYYDCSEWEWLRGALCTIDRNYGFLNYVLHNIGDTHVTHHLFVKLPHYHAREATKAMKSILGDYYHYDSTPIIKALWREATECVVIEPDGTRKKGVYWFSNEVE